jgi:hypothetical protein
MLGHIIKASGGCGQEQRILHEMFWPFFSLPVNGKADQRWKKLTHPTLVSGENGGPLLVEHHHLVLAENAPTGILGIVAKNLAISLDKGRDVEYRALVFMQFSLPTALGPPSFPRSQQRAKTHGFRLSPGPFTLSPSI